MRIGLVLFGHLRSFRAAHSSYLQFLKTLQQCGDVDVFCHTWDIEESVTASWWKENKADNPPPATVSKEQVQESFSPVKLVIEPSRQFDDSNYNVQSSIPIAGILSMLHSQYAAFNLLKENETGFKYDVIVKTRYDLLYEIAPIFTSTINKCGDINSVHLPSSNPYELIGSSSDVFAIGSRGAMEDYFSFCSDFKIAVSNYINKGYRQFLPELCMTHHLQATGVKKEELAGLRLHILRMSGDRFQINSDQYFDYNGPLCFFRGTIELSLKIIPEQSQVMNEYIERVVKKYMSWIDKEADEKRLNDYFNFYKGKWIGDNKVKDLAAKGKNNKLFTDNVMKNFFEEAMRNSKYDTLKRFLLAITLYRHSGYGSFFFRVLYQINFKSR